MNSIQPTVLEFNKRPREGEDDQNPAAEKRSANEGEAGNLATIDSLPDLVAAHLLRFVEDRELVRMKRMGRAWETCVRTNPELNLRLLRRDFLNKAGDETLKIEDRPHDRDQNFKELAKAFSHFDVPVAQRIIKLILLPDVVRRAIFETTGILARYDFLVGADFVRRHFTVQSTRNHAFGEIIYVLAQKNIQAAIAFAKEHLENHYSYIVVRDCIARLWPVDFPAAAGLAPLTDFPIQKYAAYATVKSLAKTDFSAAEKLALTIVDPSLKVRTLVTLVKIGFDQLPNNRCFLERRGVLIAAAKATISVLLDVPVRDTHLINLVYIEALYDVAAAEATTKMITDPDLKNKTLILIIRAIALTDIAAAEARALRIEDPIYKSQAFLEILRIRAEKDLSDGIVAANNIFEDPIWKARGYLAIAEVIQKKIGRTIITY